LVDGKFTDNSLICTIEGFVGIYSGRIVNESEGKAQLGIVWKKKVIEEILTGKKLGSNGFQKSI